MVTACSVDCAPNATNGISGHRNSSKRPIVEIVSTRIAAVSMWGSEDPVAVEASKQSGVESGHLDQPGPSPRQPSLERVMVTECGWDSLCSRGSIEMYGNVVEIQLLLQLELDTMDDTVDRDAMTDEVVVMIVVLLVANMVMLDIKVAVVRIEVAAPMPIGGMEMVYHPMDRPINRPMYRPINITMDRPTRVSSDRKSAAADPVSLCALTIPSHRVDHSKRGQCMHSANGLCPQSLPRSNRSSLSEPIYGISNSVVAPMRLSRKPLAI